MQTRLFSVPFAVWRLRFAASLAAIWLVSGNHGAATAQVRPVGAYGLWGVFSGAHGCWAVAIPVQGPRPEGWRAFASITHWPSRGVRGQLHVRLSRMKRPESSILLRIDGRTFQLAGRGRDAWAPNRAADAEILAAIRTGLTMSIHTRGRNGAIVRDHYQLRGVATAMDAAALACAGRR